jgi:hypothetical protein
MTLSNNKKYTYLFFLLTLLISFYYGENSSGGSRLDAKSGKMFISVFSDNYMNGVRFFINTGHDHFPFFYMLISWFEKFMSPVLVGLLYVIISSTIPLIFYNILKKKFTYSDKNILYLLSLILFFSPYVRSSAVWLTTDNLGIIFFGLAISKYLSFEKKNHNYFKYSLQCFLFLILASYIRQYYAIFFIIFFGLMMKKLKFNQLITIIIFNTLISLPALIYLYFYLLKNFFNTDSSYITDYLKPNIIFNILVFLSMCFFYFLPFLINTLNKNKIIALIDNKKKNIFFLVLSFIFLLLFYDLPIVNLGGGIFYKISKFFYVQTFYLFSFMGGLLLFVIINVNIKNLSIYLLIIFCYPVIFIYQKYYDPLIYFLFFSLIDADFINENLLKDKFNIKFIYSYLIVFLLATNIYYTL